MILHLISMGDAFGQSGVCVTDPACPTTCLWAPNNSLTYKVVATAPPPFATNVPMTQLHRDAIAAAAGAWRFGSNERLRGANWSFVEAVSTGWSNTNSENEVVVLNDVLFDDLNDDTDAFVSTYTGGFNGVCWRNGFDLMIREHPWIQGPTWVSSRQTREAKDSAGVYLESSLEATLTHEFGHVLGFGHITSVSSVMGGYGPAAAGGRVSISEYEYDQMTVLKPHSSTGNNLTLSKVMPTVVQVDVMAHAEKWDQWQDLDQDEPSNPGNTICKDFGPRDPSLYLDAVNLLHLGTALLPSVVVRWRLFPVGGQCSGPGSYLLGSRTVGNVNSNTPYSILPAGDISGAGIPVGTYAYCAFVDPDNLIVETDETDNKIESEATLAVVNSCN